MSQLEEIVTQVSKPKKNTSRWYISSIMHLLHCNMLWHVAMQQMTIQNEKGETNLDTHKTPCLNYFSLSFGKTMK
jgi:hypothetical protein